MHLDLLPAELSLHEFPCLCLIPFPQALLKLLLSALVLLALPLTLVLAVGALAARILLPGPLLALWCGSAPRMRFVLAILCGGLRAWACFPELASR